MKKSRTDFLISADQTHFKMKKNPQRRSDCPISYSLENFGDTWSLLIIRDMIYFGKKTYGDFLASDEKIASNILASRLVQLEQNGIVVKTPNPADRRKDNYTLTEKGLDLLPIVLEMAAWGAKYDPQTGAPPDWIAQVNANKPQMIELIKETVRNGGTIFVGPDSVVSKLSTA